MLVKSADAEYRLLPVLIVQGISCADVADVCVKALHDPLARNKSFDVSERASAAVLCSVCLQEYVACSLFLT